MSLIPVSSSNLSFSSPTSVPLKEKGRTTHGAGSKRRRRRLKRGLERPATGGLRRALIGKLLLRRWPELHNIHIPQNPILGGGSVRNVVGDMIPPRRDATIGTQVLTVAGLETDLNPFSNWFPFDGGIKARGGRLDHFFPGHPEKERRRGCGQVLAVAAL